MIRLQQLRFEPSPFHQLELDLQIESGQYAVLRGRSGSGKTSLLEVIAGLRRPVSGRVWISDREVTQLPPEQRGLGYVPQDRALFRTLTVREQLAFGPTVHRWPSREIAATVAEWLDKLGLTKLAQRLPAGLSGGEAARVALGRALSLRPAVLLLDEPLSGLDDESIDDVMPHLQALRQSRTCTVLHITHRQSEVLSLADVALQLRDGAIHIVAPPNSATENEPPRESTAPP